MAMTTVDCVRWRRATHDVVGHEYVSVGCEPAPAEPYGCRRMSL